MGSALCEQPAAHGKPFSETAAINSDCGARALANNAAILEHRGASPISARVVGPQHLADMVAHVLSRAHRSSGGDTTASQQHVRAASARCCHRHSVPKSPKRPHHACRGNREHNRLRHKQKRFVSWLMNLTYVCLSKCRSECIEEEGQKRIVN